MSSCRLKYRPLNSSIVRGSTHHASSTEIHSWKYDRNGRLTLSLGRWDRTRSFSSQGSTLACRGRPSGKTAGIAERYSKEIERYGEETREIQDKANEKEAETALVEKQALRFDLGEGFLELGLVLASLYFLSRKKLFPVLGCISGAGGLVLAATGLFLH